MNSKRVIACSTLQALRLHLAIEMQQLLLLHLMLLEIKAIRLQLQALLY